jgi:hypothetical protein
MSDYTNLDGYAASYVDKIITITPSGGASLTDLDIKEISVDVSIERGSQMSGGRVKATTRGSITYSGSMTVYRSGIRKIKRGLAAAATDIAKDGQGRVQLSLVRFDVDVQDKDYVPEADRTHMRALGCTIMGDSQAFAEGNDAEEVEVPIEVREMIEIIDGKEIVLL